jgi:hypothetical protein
LREKERPTLRAVDAGDSPPFQAFFYAEHFPFRQQDAVRPRAVTKVIAKRHIVSGTVVKVIKRPE